MFSNRVKNLNESVTLSLASKVKQLRKEFKNIINLTAGELDCDTHEIVKYYGIKAICDGHTKYTNVAGIEELRDYVAYFINEESQYDCHYGNVLVSNGAKQSIFNILQILIDNEDDVLLPVPYWHSYPQQIYLSNGNPIFVYPKKGFKVTSDDLEKSITKNTKMLILNSPNNPSGATYTKQELIDITNFVEKHNIYLLSDEIYSRFVYANDLIHISPASVNHKIKDKIIIINGLSKSHAMTGWRIGFAVASEKIIKKASQFQSHTTSNSSSISQYAALGALKHFRNEETILTCDITYRRNRAFDILYGIHNIDVEYPTGAFYVFPNISYSFGKEIQGKKIYNSLDFCNILLNDYGICVVPGIIFGMDKHVRISYAYDIATIEKGICGIKNLMNDLKKEE